MMKSKILLLSFAVGSAMASSAFAHLSIQCAREGRSNDVYLSDDAEGDHAYSLEDKGNAFVGKQEPIRPMEKTADSLTFLADEGTSRKWVYEYSGLKECYENDASDSVQLRISTRIEQTQLWETLTCECGQD